MFLFALFPLFLCLLLQKKERTQMWVSREAGETWEKLKEGEKTTQNKLNRTLKINFLQGVEKGEKSQIFLLLILKSDPIS